MILDKKELCSLYGANIQKELDMLFFNLINGSERDFLTLAIKIPLKKNKINPETA